MTMAYDPLEALVGLQVSVRLQMRANLRLDRLSQQFARSLAQDFRQRIGNLPWLAKGKNCSIGHGVSLLLKVFGSLRSRHDTPPQNPAVTHFRP